MKPEELRQMILDVDVSCLRMPYSAKFNVAASAMMDAS